jgi:hypothetical protein
MTAEHTEWSVTIYTDIQEDVGVLRALCEEARRRNISFGSVGIFPGGTHDEGLIRFVSFQHLTWEDLTPLLNTSGLGGLVPQEVVLEWPDRLVR